MPGSGLEGSKMLKIAVLRDDPRVFFALSDDPKAPVLKDREEYEIEKIDGEIADRIGGRTSTQWRRLPDNQEGMIMCDLEAVFADVAEDLSTKAVTISVVRVLAPTVLAEATFHQEATVRRGWMDTTKEPTIENTTWHEKQEDGLWPESVRLDWD